MEHEMDKTFKRAKHLPIVMMLLAAVYLFNFAVGNGSAFPPMVWLVLSGFFVFFSIWLFSNPAAIIDSDYIHIKIALLQQKKIPISSLKSVDTSNEKRIKLHYGDNKKMVIVLSNIEKNDRQEFVNSLQFLCEGKSA